MPVILTDKPMRDRDPNDFYPTPQWAINSAMADFPLSFRPMRILDPGCGTGVWGHTARVMYPNSEITGVDIEARHALEPSEYLKAYDNLFIQDFRLWSEFTEFDLILGNPPYKFAEEFIRHSFELLSDKGRIVFLLRLELLAGQDRGSVSSKQYDGPGLWQAYKPYQVKVLSRRPSFTGDGKTDAYEYALFYWCQPERTPFGAPQLAWSGADAYVQSWQKSDPYPGSALEKVQGENPTELHIE